MDNDVVYAQQRIPLEEVVRVAGTRWTIEISDEAARGEELGRLVSAYHAGHVGPGPADGAARRDHRSGDAKKSP